MTKLDQAIQLAGGVSKVAEIFGISPSAVSQMKRVPDKFPSERVIPLAVACDWKVTPHELRPDIYPNPTDGVPIESGGGDQEAA